eukprot:1374636-Rhodomonas_salina.1
MLRSPDLVPVGIAGSVSRGVGSRGLRCRKTRLGAAVCGVKSEAWRVAGSRRREHEVGTWVQSASHVTSKLSGTSFEDRQQRQDVQHVDQQQPESLSCAEASAGESEHCGEESSTLEMTGGDRVGQPGDAAARSQAQSCDLLPTAAPRRLMQ